MAKTFFELSKTNVMVEFRILGHEFVPEVITSELSIIPNETWVKGDKINDRDITRQYSCWILSTGYIESLDINDQIKEIINKLLIKNDKLVEIKKKYNVIYRIDVVINIENNEKPAIYLNSDIIEFAYSIGAEFDFDLYIYS